MSDTLGPNFALKIGNTPMDAGILQLVDRVEYESADGIADVGKLTCRNPGFWLSESRYFTPGNDLVIYMGYGQRLSHIGTVRIYKVVPDFPKNGPSTISIVGYTRDHEMMHDSPPATPRAQRQAGGRRGRPPDGRNYRQQKHSDAVTAIAADYGFGTDIDPTPEQPTNFLQKAGLSDYDFVQGLANINGFLFWVDADEEGFSTLHFKDPQTLDIQELKYTFEYNAGDLTTLFDFKPEYAISDGVSEIRVRVQNADGTIIEAEVTEELDSGGLVQVTPDEDVEAATVDEAPGDAASVQLAIGDYSFQEYTNRHFRTAAEATRWAQQWFRRNRENYVLSEGTAIGIETVRSREVHDITGVGRAFSGTYYFSRVRHLADKQGYTMDFNCRKQTPLPP
jgi:phage protein D